jgi:hypothetical protein
MDLCDITILTVKQLRPLIYYKFFISSEICKLYSHLSGARGGAVSLSTALEVWRSRFRFPIMLWKFPIDNNPSGRTMALGSTEPLTEMRSRSNYWGSMRPVFKADNFTTFMWRLSWNPGVSTSFKLLGLSRCVRGLLLLLYLQLFRLLIL